MSKVLIIQLKEKTYSTKPVVMSWEEYLVYCTKVSGEGVTWKAELVY